MWVDYRGSLSTVYNDGEMAVLRMDSISLVTEQQITLQAAHFFPSGGPYTPFLLRSSFDMMISWA